MKKSLLLLPLAGLFLASCGAANGELPSGGKTIDPKDEKSVTTYAVRVADCVEKTVVGAKNGVKLTASSKVDDLSVSYAVDDKNASISIKDAEFTASIAADFLDKKSINEWKVAAEITAKGKFAIDIPDPAIKMDFDLKDFKISAYLSEGTFYLDLTNSELASLAETVVSKVAGKSASIIMPIVKEVLIKNKIAGISSMVDVPTIPSNVITSEVKAEISTAVLEAIGYISAAEDFKGVVNFVNYDDGRLGFSFSASDSNIYKGADAEVTGKISAALLFAKDGKFESVSEAGEITAKVKEDGKEVATIHYKGEGSLKAEYGVSISMPDFSDYKTSKIPEIIGTLIQLG